MSMGKRRSTMPASPMVNLYSASLSMLGTAMRVAIMAATDRKSQTI